MARHQFAQYIAEVGSERQVAAFVELLFFQARPLAINLSAFDAAAHHEHAVGVAVVGAAGRALALSPRSFRCTPSLGSRAGPVRSCTCLPFGWECSFFGLLSWFL